MSSRLRRLLAPAALSLLLLASVFSPPTPTAAPALREAPRARLDEVLFAHGAHISRRAWVAHSASPPPIFFMTCARAWAGSSPEAAEARNSQYAANIGGVLALGYDVVLAVSPTEGAWPLLGDLAAAAAPGQLRVHLCAPSAEYQGRSGPDETRCMQEALRAVWGACVDGDGAGGRAARSGGCPARDTHIVKVSGRYLIYEPTLVRAIFAEPEMDAFAKYGMPWDDKSRGFFFPQL